jgi:C1A family cysteine protease
VLKLLSKEKETPHNIYQWAQIAKDNNITSIHITEYDTQQSNNLYHDHLVNTWEVSDFVKELANRPSEATLGTNEEKIPNKTFPYHFGDKSSVCFVRTALNMKIKSWIPNENNFNAYLTPNYGAVSLGNYMTIYNGNDIVYRPTILHAYKPCDQALASLNKTHGIHYKKNDFSDVKTHVMTEKDIDKGSVTLGVLLNGDTSYWYGSTLSIDDVRKISSYGSVNSVLSAITLLTSTVWAIKNQRKGIVDMFDVDHDTMINMVEQYLGDIKMISHNTSVFSSNQLHSNIYATEIMRDFSRDYEENNITNRLGCKWGSYDVRDHYMEFNASNTSLNVNISDKLRDIPIYSQDVLGSCTANALATLYTYAHIIKHNEIFMPSRLFIYYNERVIEGSVNVDVGAEMRNGMKSLSTTGTCPESMWIYDITKFRCKPNDTCYIIAKNHKTIKYNRVKQTLDQLKSCLQEGYPFVLSFLCYESFEKTAETGILKFPQPKEKVYGAHAVIAVGYIESEKMFIIRNSHGVTFGKNGHFYMPYDFICNPTFVNDIWTIHTVT